MARFRSMCYILTFRISCTLLAILYGIIGKWSLLAAAIGTMQKLLENDSLLLGDSILKYRTYVHSRSLARLRSSPPTMPNPILSAAACFGWSDSPILAFPSSKSRCRSGNGIDR